MPVLNPRRAYLRALGLAFLAVLVFSPDAKGFGSLCGDGGRPVDIRQLNARLAGHVDDYTTNHGPDNRIESPSLGQKRDIYVYVPPGYDPAKRYPLMIWLHGLSQDEQSFLE